METLIPDTENNDKEIDFTKSSENRKPQNTNKKHFSIYLIGVLYILNSLRYLSSALMLLVIIAILNISMLNALDGVGLEFSSLKIIPEQLIVVFLNLIVFVFLIYQGLRLFNGSKETWASSAKFQMVLGLVFIPTALLLGSSVMSINSFVNERPQSNIGNITYNLLLGGAISYLYNIGLFALMHVFKKHYTHANRGLNKFSKFIYISIVSIILLISLYFFGYGLWKAYNPDYKKEQVSKEVGYYLYQPNKNKTALIQESIFHNYELKENEPALGLEKVVRSLHNNELKETVKTGESLLTIMLQYKPNENFNMQKYLKEGFDSLSSTQIEMPNSKGGIGYYLENPNPKGLSLKAVVFESTEDTVVVIMSPQLENDSLIDFAKSLE